MTSIADLSRMRNRAEKFFGELQYGICSSLETLEATARFNQDLWTHEEGGGGRTRILEQGAVFERAGVNFSAVSAQLSERMSEHLSVDAQQVFATGISLILHPLSPMIPTVHLNLRYIELGNGDAWFGGGADLTPFYLFDEDVRHFHQTLKSVCDKHDSSYYPRFKKECDEYFYLKHRGEARGVGGVFFDYQRENPEKLFLFVQEMGTSFLDAYLPIVRRRRDDKWGQREKEWQAIRRGRYVEFNLVYDRGTLFGLDTGGRTESILISLPPEVKWPYTHKVDAGSREAELLDVLRVPRSWI